MYNTYIFPAKCSLATFTVDVSHSMEASQQDPFFCRTTANIHTATTHRDRPSHYYQQSHCNNTQRQTITLPPTFTLQQHTETDRHITANIHTAKTQTDHHIIANIHTATTQRDRLSTDIQYPQCNNTHYRKHSHCNNTERQTIN